MSAAVLLKDVFGFDAFRPGQQEIVEAVIAGENTLAIMPTGGGKSLCFPTACIGARRRHRRHFPADRPDARPSARLARGRGRSGRADLWKHRRRNRCGLGGLEAGTLKLLYMAPERLASGGTMQMLRRVGVSMIAVDEAHCVSQWGHDFPPRLPAHRRIAATLDVPLAAFTATADAETRAEIVQKLFDGVQPATFLRGFDRPNIHLAFAVKDGPRAQILNFAAARKGQSGIVYCGTRAKTETLAKALRDAGTLPAITTAAWRPKTAASSNAAFSKKTG